MQDVSGNNIRETFLRFFEEKGHRRVASSSLVPANDPTLLFTNAGMNQFKDVFTGAEKREYTRAASSQKCVRAGGKHNDLENVGFTRRHHTFFEMLGNFSFGDYFKREAIAFAWELITSPEWFGIPEDRLYVTIFEGDLNVPRDDEAEQHWIETGVPRERIFACGAKDNFWQMGETGPCGPCSEIFYDMGLEASNAGKDLPFGEDDDRYVEIWNLVFMQFERAIDHREVEFANKSEMAKPYLVDVEGEVVDIIHQKSVPVYSLTPLPKPSIDTGMGLERVAAVLQNKISNFETDLFTPLIARAGELTGLVKGHDFSRADSSSSENGALAPEAIESLVSNASLRIIADHARAATFLLSDGVLPSNEGRGYVLRKILRRGIRHGRLLGQEQPFLYEMVYAVRDIMSGAYPELVDSASRVAKVVEAEEKQFDRVLKTGSIELDRKIQEAKLRYDTRPNDTRYRSSSGPKLPGYEGFRLYETYGLPLDFIQDACRDAGIDFDLGMFELARAEEQARARASWKGGSTKTASPAFRDLPKTDFRGYSEFTATGAEVLAIVKDGFGVPSAKAGDHVDIVLDRTTFYGDSGGQVGDTGRFTSPDGNLTVAEITGCVLPVQGVRAHKAILKQDLAVGDRVNTRVNGDRRYAIKRNHTGTHLLHAALRQVLGTHVKQAGSLVDAGHLRFDFSHCAQVADEELEEIESIVNREVLSNAQVQTYVDVPIDVAVNEYHAMALFGEKYGDKVRVVRIGDFSTELCGGTHTAATGEIGLIKILKEGSVSSGVRRLEAITGEGSLQHFRRDHQLENVVSSFVSSHPSKTAKGGAASSDIAPDSEKSFSPAEALKAELEKKDAEIRRLTRELDQVRMKSASSSTANIGERVKEVKGVKVLAHRVDNLERAQMRTLVDQLRDKIGSGVVVLGSAMDGNVALIVGVTKDLTSRIQAGKVIGPIAQKVGGKGGGRPDLAEAGGKDASALDAALDGAYDVVEGLLA